jgi:hypothetical protein
MLEGTGAWTAAALTILGVAASSSGPATVSRGIGPRGVSPQLSVGWNEIPDTKLRAVSPPNRESYNYRQNFVNVIQAWGGAAYDSRRQRLWLFGGGHNDYYGNESYVFDASSRRWSRLDDPSDLSEFGNVQRGTSVPCLDAWADGKPSSRHSYDHLEYLPRIDRYVMYGGVRGCAAGGAGQDTWFEDPETGNWTQMQRSFDRQTQPASYGTTPGRSINAMAVHPDGFLYAMNSDRLRRYDPVRSVWSVASAPYSIPPTLRTAVINPAGSRFVSIGAAAGQAALIRWFNLKAGPDTRLQTVQPQTLSSVLSKKAPGFDVDPKTGKAVAWAGGDEIVLIDLDTFEMETRTFPGGPVAPGCGMFGRFRYSAALDGFLAVTSVDDNVHVLRLR